MRAAHASFVRRTVDAHPDDGQLLAYASVVARRGGDIATAVDWARRAVAIDDSFLALNALARSSVMADDWVGACTAWQQAIANDPTNALLWLDWADATLDRREFDDASERYWQALACDPENDWAQGSLAYIQYLQTPSARAWSELRSWSLANPTNQRGTRVLQMSTPGAGWLPNPIEAMYNGWTQMRANNADLSGANITLSHLEGPSVLHAIRTHVTDFGHRFEEIQTPDPRTPLFEGAVSLWTWDDQTPSPALPPANENIQLLVQELAVQRFDAWAWLDHAKQRAANLGVDDVQQLLACAVHPTTAPEPFDALTWFWRVQHAVAYLLAGYPIAMPESPSIQGLDAMLAVRNDWNAMAALSAMVTLGESVPDIRMHAWGRCYQILQAYPQGGDFLIGDNAYWGLLRLDPNDEAGLANQACAWIDKT